MSVGEQYKNVKLKEHFHILLKKISNETGINIGKLVEMGSQKIIEDYQAGEFDKIVNLNETRIRRDGTLSRK